MTERDEYTPSVDEAREAYANGVRRLDPNMAVRRAEFDRMIETVRAEERERCARMPIQMPRVTRVEVIDRSGRAFVAYYEPGIEVHVQDDGRTVKIFGGEVLNSRIEKGDD